MQIIYNNITLSVVGTLEQDPDAYEVNFEVNKIKHKGHDVTEIYESLDLISDISDACKQQLIYGKL